jgi:hypothetical protein
MYIPGPLYLLSHVYSLLYSFVVYHCVLCNYRRGNHILRKDTTSLTLRAADVQDFFPTSKVAVLRVPPRQEDASSITGEKG